LRRSDTNEHKAIRCVNVTKIYNLGSYKIEALKDIDFEVNHGDLVSLMGPSGSGKSTLLHILGTLDRPTSGRVYVDGVDITEFPETKLSEFRRDKVGFVFQFFNLATHLTAIENVTLPMLLAKKYNNKEATERAILLLKLVGLPEERFKNTPRQLSGGQQQMVAIARALANDPSFILTDEPTGNLDLESSARVTSMIRFLNSTIKLTFIIVTHNPEVAAIAPLVRFMKGGKLFERPPESFLATRVAQRETQPMPERADLFSSLFDLEEKAIKRRFVDGEIDESELRSQLDKIEEMRRPMK